MTSEDWCVNVHVGVTGACEGVKMHVGVTGTCEGDGCPWVCDGACVSVACAGGGVPRVCGSVNVHMGCDGCMWGVTGACGV